MWQHDRHYSPQGDQPELRNLSRLSKLGGPSQHTNGSENDVRSFVTKRRISGETRSAAGKQARDTFLSLLKTCSKLAVSFWDYLGARLKIPDADCVPWLPDLIRQNVPA